MADDGDFDFGGEPDQPPATPGTAPAVAQYAGHSETIAPDSGEGSGGFDDGTAAAGPDEYGEDSFNIVVEDDVDEISVPGAAGGA